MTIDEASFPPIVQSEEELDELLSRPTARTIETVGRFEGDILVLGVAGKIGPSLARMAVRAVRAAGKSARVIGVARFSEARVRQQLESCGVETIACDLLDAAAPARVPRAANVLYLVGRKFGAAGTEGATWATNTALPLALAEVLREAQRIVAFSTGCVYPLVSVHSDGSREEEPCAPVGEYGWSSLGRERIFEYLCQQYRVATLLYRLNYAQALRYGVLTDLAVTVARDLPVSLKVPAVNIIWQGDANNWALQCLAQTRVPAAVLNITGPEKLWVKDIAAAMAECFGKPAHFEGEPGPVAYLSDARQARELFGAPQVSPEMMIRWTAEWVKGGMPLLGKPTHFDVTDGQFLG